MKDRTVKTRQLALKLADAQAVTLVHAVEKVDRSGRLLPLENRQQATQEARQLAGRKADDPRRWLGVRARQLVEDLRRYEPRLGRVLAASNVARGLWVPVIVLALALGLSTSALGPERRFNILAAPLLALIAWNLIVLALFTVRRWLPGWRSIERREHPPLLAALQRGAEKLAEKLPLKRRPTDAEKEDHHLLRTALADFLRRWLPSVQHLAAARVRRLFHLGALALVAGVVAGMYLRGIVFEYAPTWESTFLDGHAVDAFLRLVLAPAAWLSGLNIPRAQEIRFPLMGTAEMAQAWIHLYAITALLFVGLPRGLLIGFESLREVRAARKVLVELPEAYLRRLAAAVKGGGERVEILPYSFAPSPKAIEHLKQLLFDLFGPRADLRLLASAEYGAESEELPLEPARCLVVIFSLAQTPELEVHGELLQELTQQLPDGEALIVLLDDSTYKRRLEATTAEGRLSQRQRAWERVVRAAGLEPVVIDLARPLPDETLNHLVAAAWPQGILAEGR